MAPEADEHLQHKDNANVPSLIEYGDDGTLAFNWHDGQVLMLDSRARFTFVLKGMQGGYTSSCMRWLHNEMKRCGPGSRDLSYLALTPTLQVARNKLIPTMRGYFCDTLGFGHYSESKKISIEINERGQQALWGHRQPQPTHIYFCYAEQPNSFAGFTALAAIGDEINQEEFKYSAWRELRGRLSVPSGQVAPHNPEGWDGMKMGRFMGGSTVYALNWLERFYRQWLKCLRNGVEHPEFDFIRFDSTMNPAFSQEEWDAARASMDEEDFDMRYRALFRRPKGLIYNCWNPKYELDVEGWKPPAGWPRAAAFDLGDVNFYGFFAAQNPETQRWRAYKSYHDSELSFKERGRVLSEMEPNLEWCIAGQVSEGKWRNELISGGLICTEPPIKDFWPGITTGIAGIRNGLFEVVESEFGDFLDEMGTYRRPINSGTGEVVTGVLPVDKEKFHYMDVFRYFALRAWWGQFSRGSLRAGGERASTQKQTEKTGTALPTSSPTRSPALLRAGGGKIGRARARKYGDAGMNQPYLDINIG